MKMAYADPPYLGQCSRYGHRHETPYGCWNDLETHRLLIRNLRDEYPDGWALSLSASSQEDMLHLCREELGRNMVRVSPWVKPFAVYKPNVNPGYTWEPVIWVGGRNYERYDPTVRDFHVENVTLKKGIPGAKPPRFPDFILAQLGVDFSAGDTIDDLFPGSHGVTVVFNERHARVHRLRQCVSAHVEALTTDVNVPEGYANGELY